MNKTLFNTGLGCIIAAMVGGGLKAFDVDFPVLHTLNRQLAVGLLGVILVEASFTSNILTGLKSNVRARTIAYAFFCIVLLFTSIVAVVVVTDWIISTHRAMAKKATPEGEVLFSSTNSPPASHWQINGNSNVPPGPMKIGMGQSAWWTGTSRDKITTLEFKALLREGQGKMHWIASPSKNQIFTLAFPQIGAGVAGVSSLAVPDKTYLGETSIGIPPTLANERLNVWVDILDPRAGEGMVGEFLDWAKGGCQLRYRFKATPPPGPFVPGPMDIPPGTEAQIRQSLIPRADLANSVRCSTKFVTVGSEFCSDKLKIGFSTPEQGPDFQLIEVSVNKGTSEEELSCRAPMP